jgi:hypothetical protein
MVEMDFEEYILSSEEFLYILSFNKPPLSVCDALTSASVQEDKLIGSAVLSLDRNIVVILHTWRRPRCSRGISAKLLPATSTARVSLILHTVLHFFSLEKPFGELSHNVGHLFIEHVGLVQFLWFPTVDCEPQGSKQINFRRGQVCTQRSFFS